MITRRNFVKGVLVLPAAMSAVSNTKAHGIPSDNVIFCDCCLMKYPCEEHRKHKECPFGCDGTTTYYNGYRFCAETNMVHWYPEPFQSHPCYYGAVNIHSANGYWFKEWFHSEGRLFWISNDYDESGIAVNDIYEFVVGDSWVELTYFGTGHFDLQGDLHARYGMDMCPNFFRRAK